MKPKSQAVQAAAILVIAVCFLVGPTFAQDCPELTGQLPGGRAFAVAESWPYTYFGSGNVLLVADVSNPASPYHRQTEVVTGEGDRAFRRSEGFLRDDVAR